jgi:hypothetical protein
VPQNANRLVDEPRCGERLNGERCNAIHDADDPERL